MLVVCAQTKKRPLITKATKRRDRLLPILPRSEHDDLAFTVAWVRVVRCCLSLNAPMSKALRI